MGELHIIGLSKVFSRSGHEVVALEGFDLHIADNEFVSIVGASGCGKTTLLSIVAGLESPSSGSVDIDGIEIAGPGRDRGVVFQSYTLFPWKTALDNVAFALRSDIRGRQERRAVAMEHLRLVGLDSFSDAYPSELSGGMKQRVAIARALSYRPEVLLMDEPFGALDALTRQAMQELLTEIWERHRINVMFVTHDVEEAIYISDRVIVMTSRPGRVKEEVHVRLPRPRTHELIHDTRFLEYRNRVLESIRDEVAPEQV